MVTVDFHKYKRFYKFEKHVLREIEMRELSLVLN
jgi:hypothetical protein